MPALQGHFQLLARCAMPDGGQTRSRGSECAIYKALPSFAFKLPSIWRSILVVRFSAPSRLGNPLMWNMRTIWRRILRLCGFAIHRSPILRLASSGAALALVLILAGCQGSAQKGQQDPTVRAVPVAVFTAVRQDMPV